MPWSAIAFAVLAAAFVVVVRFLAKWFVFGVMAEIGPTLDGMRPSTSAWERTNILIRLAHSPEAPVWLQEQFVAAGVVADAAGIVTAIAVAVGAGLLHLCG